MDGICTLANDNVFDQLVALLNSIEVNHSNEIPVCIYPYNNNIERITAEISTRPNVQIYNDLQSIEKWDKFFRDVWDAHPNAHQRRLEKGFTPYYRFGHHRPFCAFDGPFDRFLYIDADALLMGPVDGVFDRLNQSDWVVYDFQYKDPGHVYDISSPRLEELFPQEYLKSRIFCSGFYASKKGIFKQENIDWFLGKLREGESEILYIWAADQPILNYMVMRLNLKVDNLAISLSPNEKTGNSVTSKHFEEQDHIVYDRGKRLTYLHYIGVSSKAFTRVCEGENLDFPYREIFLHYRYLHEPEKKPKFIGKPKPYNPPPSLIDKIFKKIGLSS
ncbi:MULTISPECIES: Npun_R2821/Npun_R2822 family protein [Okeania]|uniref:Sugar transferase n=2 Tax=Okeania TaxID=1458928 RepID=A0A3N6NRC3_9CYAN|nr:MULTISPECIES: Npun_R2821/Npun_R2822 family protein [Okeania]NET12491.1 sugar transferase [Okeania sp. SIO1H6]NES76462.1 sugar transferase [Okeania sp. SIO1H4]NET22470.1 sugar transferase [Okeania sp. SIO1H5]NET79407.1 sugar transferase [Okeania sp. SIO1F9]NET95933.1 sugar transferase [Okeania sp. SIO1H2]